jgi:3-hydroxyisobutyrate dehydrogenase/putative dehydrogenase
MSVGWLGLGAMGAPMAGRAARAGHEITAYDVVEGRADGLAAVRAVDSAAAAASGAAVLALMVATPAQAEAALFESGAADALEPGAVVLLMATVGPDAARAMAARLRAGGIDLVDAPVSGGVRRAGEGDLLVIQSGEAGALAKVESLVAALASSAPVVGQDPGDGQKVKLVNQLLCGVHLAAAAEALAFAEALGLDARECWEVVRRGAAASFMLDNRGERMLRGEFDDVASAMDIFVKDMGLVRDAARASGYASPLADTTAGLFNSGREAGLRNLDDAALIDVLRRHDTEG